MASVTLASYSLRACSRAACTRLSVTELHLWTVCTLELTDMRPQVMDPLAGFLNPTTRAAQSRRRVAAAVGGLGPRDVWASRAYLSRTDTLRPDSVRPRPGGVLQIADRDPFISGPPVMGLHASPAHRRTVSRGVACASPRNLADILASDDPSQAIL